MNTNYIKKIFGLTLLFLGFVTFFTPKNLYAQETSQPDLHLYVSDTCGHCQTVKEKIADDNLDEVLNLIYHNTSDSDYEESRTEANATCKIDSGGVPMMQAEGFCYLGSTEVALALDYYVEQSEGSGEPEDENSGEIEGEETANNDNQEESETGSLSNESDTGSDTTSQEDNTVSEKDNTTETSTQDSETKDSSIPRPTLRVLDKVVLIIAPLSFVVIMFLIIKSLKL